MISTDQAQQLLNGGGNVVDSEGNKIGSIGQLFIDDQTNNPEWVTVKTGLFGGGESFVPLRDSTVDGDDLQVPYTKDKVKDAPRIEDASGHLSQEEEAMLYSHYGTDGVDYDTTSGHETRDTSGDDALAAGGRDSSSDRDTLSSVDTTTGSDTGAGHDTSGPDTDSAMTRSEEQLHVGTETRETGRARLRKYVVTEDVTTTVPVSHEEVRLEREPVTAANRDEALTGGDITEEEHEVVLTEERPVVTKETVPVERVRVDKDTVTEQQQVDETVRKEEIELDEPGTSDSRSDR